jgi:hypothetical protein
MFYFIKKIFLFSSIVFFSMLLLFTLPMDKGFFYRFIKGDCYGHGAYLWHRMAKNSAPIDIAFIGSSHTIHAVWESKIEDLLEKEGVSKPIIANLGYCRLGENFPYLILKDLLKYRKPRLCIFEIRPAPDAFSHPMFGYLADAEDVLCPEKLLHQRQLSDLIHATNVRLQSVQNYLWTEKLDIIEGDTSQYGYGADTSRADKSNLSDLRKRKEKKTKVLELTDFPKKYIEKTMALAAQNQVKVAFLYLPEYGKNMENPPAFMEFYQQYGEVWLPPTSIFENMDYWMDEGHLNDRGAEEMAKWLAEKI